MSHKLLARQLSRLGLSLDQMPSKIEDWRELLAKVAKAYADADNERYLNERSLQISSEEMQIRWRLVQSLEEQWRSLGECAPDLILMVDLNGRVTFANHGRNRHTKQDLIGIDLKSLYLPDEAGGAFQTFLDVITHRSTGEIEIKGSGPAGETRHYSQRIHPVIKDGLVTGAVVVETDVTENAILETAIESERAQAAHSAKFATLGEMASGIAHEINSPLTAIQLLAGSIRNRSKDHPHSEQIGALASKIELTIERISKIIKGLRTFARQSDGDPFTAVKVSEVIENSLELSRNRMQKEMVELTVEPFDPELTLECQSTQLTQVIMNLCGNAADAMKGRSDKKIRISVEDLGEFIDLSVTDNGPGIPPAIREKIMNPFFTTKQPGEGTGLGLSISRGIAGQHGGQLFLDEKSSSTRFVMRLPKKHTEQKAA